MYVVFFVNYCSRYRAMFSGCIDINVFRHIYLDIIYIVSDNRPICHIHGIDITPTSCDACHDNDTMLGAVFNIVPRILEISCDMFGIH